MRATSSFVGRLASAFASAPRGVVSAYLFGSHATGRTHRDSDLDVGVLLDYAVYPQRHERLEARIALIGVLQAALGRNDVDVVVLNDSPATLAREITSNGERVFCGVESIDHAFRRDAQLRAADLAPFLERTRRAKLAAIRE